MIILPFIAFILIFLNFFNLKRMDIHLREKILIALIVWSIIYTVSTELLSIFNKINFINISAAWIILCLLLVALLFFNKPKTAKSAWNIPVLDTTSKILIAFIIFIIGISLFLAIYTAPNDIDALIYHLARIPHWIQNQSISYYPTHLTWQIFHPPFASYIKLHFQILSGGDWFSNSIQWIYALGSMIGVSLITKYFRGNTQHQVLSAFIAATIPMGIVQTSSSLNDYVFTFFMICFIYFALIFKKWHTHKYLLLLSGLSLGLACFTKELGYLYSLPFLYWFLWKWTNNFGLMKSIYYSILLVLLIIPINMGFFLRNIAFMGQPLFTMGHDDYLYSNINIKTIISGTIKYISHHLSTPFIQVNQHIYYLLDYIHNKINFPLNTLGVNFHNYNFEIPKYLSSQYTAPNTVHFILIIVSSFLLKIIKQKELIIYFLCIIADFVLLAIFHKWNFSGSRFHLLLFLTVSPCLALTLLKLKSIVRNVILIIIALNALFFLLFNIASPLISERPVFSIPREEQYFLGLGNYSKRMYIPYRRISNKIKTINCKKVGLISEERYFDLEYALWILLSSQVNNFQLEHVEVTNPSKAFDNNTFIPECIIFLSGDIRSIQKYNLNKIPIIPLFE